MQDQFIRFVRFLITCGNKLENQDVRFFKNLSYEELTEINGGGFLIPFIAIGAAAGAAVAIYEAGKATSELIYHITH